MNKALTAIPSGSSEQVEIVIEQYLADIDELREQISRDQVEIDRSRIRTQAMLDELMAMLKPASQKAA